MNCQECDEPATCHISEIVEKDLCDAHAEKLYGVKPKPIEPTPAGEFWQLSALAAALRDSAGQQQFAAHLLPVLCLALLDKNPVVRVLAARGLLLLGRHAQSASGALRDALGDADQRVRKAVQLALQHIQTDADPLFL
jgi:hypothetical protein